MVMRSKSAKRAYSVIKRICDILVAVISLIILIIPMLLVVAAIKIEDHGPVFFKQKRTGKNGKEFELIKFRSMSISNNVLDFRSENKVTKVGKFIRKTSLDEIPQIINVLKGEMSFIGPRPWIVEYYNNFTDEQKRRVEVLPGMTGLAQAIGRNNLTILDKIKYDLEYVDNFSLKMDLKVVFLTIKTVLTKEGAEISKSEIKGELDDLKNNYMYVTGKIPQIYYNKKN